MFAYSPWYGYFWTYRPVSFVYAAPIPRYTFRPFYVVRAPVFYGIWR